MIARRALLAGLPAVAGIGAAASSSPPPSLQGFALAAEYGRLAAEAMASVPGSWELTIISGDADQSFGFAQLGVGASRVRRILRQAKAKIEAATGDRWVIIGAADDEQSVVALARYYASPR
jgi:flavin-dependent dehydrogenase